MSGPFLHLADAMMLTLRRPRMTVDGFHNHTRCLDWQVLISTLLNLIGCAAISDSITAII